MATELAKAYVQIIPSARGIGEGIQKEIDGSGVGQKAGSSIASGIGSALKGVGGTVAASLGAAMAGVGAVAKEAFSSFANYQQLTGGIETLFGAGGKSLEEFASEAKATKADIENSGINWDKYANTAWMQNGGLSGMFDEMKYNIEELGTSADELAEYLHFEYDLDMSDAVAAVKAYQDAVTDEDVIKKYSSLKEAQDLVMSNAANAWQTAGLNANEYMETVSSFAASLKQSTSSTIEAANAADMAVQDMADNSAKMGTSMEAIQNAYNGFAKQNYTMLDNLKLGGLYVLAEYKPRENGETLTFVA